MDPLSAAASIITVMQVTGTILTYLFDVKNAPKECQQFTIEASNLQSLFSSLRFRVEEANADDPWFAAIQSLNAEHGPLDQYRQALQRLASQLGIGAGADQLKRRILWHFKKEETEKILASIERLKSLVSLALANDHFKLSQAIRDDTSYTREKLPVLQNSLVAIRTAQNEQISKEALQEHLALLRSLSTSDYPAQQLDIIGRRQEGTGQWFLESSSFKTWLKGERSILFCPGIPGAGKTMIAAIAIDFLEDASSANDGLVYVFCNYKQQDSQSLVQLLSAMLKQLLYRRPDLVHAVEQFRAPSLTRQTNLSATELVTALTDVCSKLDTVHVVVDALDECSSSGGTRMQFIEALLDIQKETTLRVMATSRFLPQVSDKFTGCLELEIRATEEDVRRFVSGQIPRLPACVRRDADLMLQIESTISKATDGMFLLARLHVDSLLDKRTKAKVLSTLNSLLKGPEALHKAYGDAIKRIDCQQDEDRLLARRAISWICLAKRPLTVQQLCTAMAVESGDRDLNTDNVFEVDDIISVSAGLVTIDEETNIVRLVHYTTQEYFQQQLSAWQPKAQEEIAIICLTYLSFDSLHSDDFWKTFSQKDEQFGIIEYIAHYWPEHVQPVEFAIYELVFHFVQYHASVLNHPNDEVFRYWNRDVRHVWEGPRLDVEEGGQMKTRGLYVSARYGLYWTAKTMLTIPEHAALIDCRDKHGQTPLSYAARHGHEAVVKLLVETGKVDINHRCNIGRPLLSFAIEKRHIAVTQILLESGKADVKCKDQRGLTLLHYAAQSYYDAAIVFLLGTGELHVDCRDDHGLSPLHYAVAHKRSSTVNLLLNRYNADINLQANNGETPLYKLFGSKWDDVPKLMWGKDMVDLGEIDAENSTLQTAVIVKLLLEAEDLDINLPERDGRTILHEAARYDRTAAEVLIAMEVNGAFRKNLDVNVQDSFGLTPLHDATLSGNRRTVLWLLATKTIDIHLQNCYGQTAFDLALLCERSIIATWLKFHPRQRFFALHDDIESFDKSRLTTHR